MDFTSAIDAMVGPMDKWRSDVVGCGRSGSKVRGPSWSPLRTYLELKPSTGSTCEVLRTHQFAFFIFDTFATKSSAVIDLADPDSHLKMRKLYRIDVETAARTAASVPLMVMLGAMFVVIIIVVVLYAIASSMPLVRK